MEKIPETTVVITCFNYGQYLEGCLRSVLAQTYDDFEILVIDDGSTDHTPEIMKNFKGLSNLNYIRQENRGQANAKNRGITQARGRYVAFLDADDLWEKEKLEMQIQLFEKSDIGVVYSNSRPIDSDGNLLKWGRPRKYLLPRSGKVTNWLYFDNFILFSSSVVRKKCFSDVGIFNESLKMGIDWDLWLRISTCYKFDFVDKELVLYRTGHPGQMSKNVEIRQNCSDLIMENFIKDYPDSINDHVVKKAYSYTFCNRHDYYRSIDKKLSYKYLIRAFMLTPFNFEIYRRIIYNIVKN